MKRPKIKQGSFALHHHKKQGRDKYRHFIEYNNASMTIESLLAEQKELLLNDSDLVAVVDSK